MGVSKLDINRCLWLLDTALFMPGELMAGYAEKTFNMGLPSYKLPSMPWDKNRALGNLAITEITFNPMDVTPGTQGYSELREDKIAIYNGAQLPHKTLFHEIAHCLCHVPELPQYVKEFEAECVALLLVDHLELPGAKFCRGAIQESERGIKLLSLDNHVVTPYVLIKSAQTILEAGL